MHRAHPHCPSCGARFARNQEWPRTCGVCGRVSYLNPLPVAVLLVPVDDGLLVIRRGMSPGLGRLALPGGFVELGETWQEAAARELWEETNLEVHPHEIQDWCVLTDREGYLLIFGLVPARREADLPPFRPSDEATERVVLEGPTELAFPLHTEAMTRWFGR